MLSPWSSHVIQVYTCRLFSDSSCFSTRSFLLWTSHLTVHSPWTLRSRASQCICSLTSPETNPINYPGSLTRAHFLQWVFFILPHSLAVVKRKASLTFLSISGDSTGIQFHSFSKAASVFPFITNTLSPQSPSGTFIYSSKLDTLHPAHKSPLVPNTRVFETCPLLRTGPVSRHMSLWKDFCLFLFSVL